MPSKPLFLIVDDANPADQAAQLRQSLKLSGLSGDVKHTGSPAEMIEVLRAMAPQAPAVILLDHHWPETTIEKVLGDLHREAPSSRIVVYTGQRIEPSTIVVCARYGAVEYLTKGAFTGEGLARKLAALASDPDNTIQKLRARSGAMEQVLQEAEKAVKELDFERAARQKLESDNIALRSKERREVYEKIARFTSVVLYLCVCASIIFVAARQGLGAGWYIPLILVEVCGFAVIDQSISHLSVSLWKSRLRVNRK